jgi:hypothetical protein
MTSTNRKFQLPFEYLVLIILIATAVLLPFGYSLDLGPGPNRVRALIWEYMDAPWFSGIRFVLFGQVLEGILYTFPRYIFIFLVYDLYRSLSKRKRIWSVGILGALFPGLVSLVRIVGWLQGWTQPPPPISDHQFPIYIPIPLVIIVSIILIRLFPFNSDDDTEPSNHSLEQTRDSSGFA